MIARLRGWLRERTPEEVVIDVGGVGYQLFVSAQTLAALPAEGEEVELLTVTHLREDALQLFGFAEAAERMLFQMLQSVSGIGPRLALGILSGMPVEELREAIRRRDLVRLTRIPGVGKKIAERLSLELADKLLALPAERAPRRDAALGDVGTRAVSALINLQFRPAEAERAVEGALAAGFTTLEEVVREALRSTRR
ncbi:MAG: Holliday junction branch migration protein RuvA [Deltaproteobacteria bacterium]|nr:Holliday junction branch migration protein RuvA [Deltaproteobacteria bacterium]